MRGIVGARNTEGSPQNRIIIFWSPKNLGRARCKKVNIVFLLEYYSGHLGLVGYT